MPDRDRKAVEDMLFGPDAGGPVRPPERSVAAMQRNARQFNPGPGPVNIDPSALRAEAQRRLPPLRGQPELVQTLLAPLVNTFGPPDPSNTAELFMEGFGLALPPLAKPIAKPIMQKGLKVFTPEEVLPILSTQRRRAVKTARKGRGAAELQHAQRDSGFQPSDWGEEKEFGEALDLETLAMEDVVGSDVTPNAYRNAATGEFMLVPAFGDKKGAQLLAASDAAGFLAADTVGRGVMPSKYTLAGALARGITDFNDLEKLPVEELVELAREGFALQSPGRLLMDKFEWGSTLIDPKTGELGFLSYDTAVEAYELLSKQEPLEELLFGVVGKTKQ